VIGGPSGAECECIACGRIFGGLTSFDRHQRWTGRGEGAVLVCQNPRDHGLRPRTRRGSVVVWVHPSDPAGPPFLRGNEAAQVEAA